MKISAFIALYNAHPELKDAEFAVADGCLCIIGPKADHRYWHVPVMPVSSNVSRESVSNRLANGLAQAGEVAKSYAPAGLSAKRVDAEAAAIKKAIAEA